MTPSSDTRLSSLYNDLYKYSKGLDYEKAVKACNRILHQFPGEKTAFKTKIACCINLARFQDALDFISKNPKMSSNLEYEKSYCLYRLHKIEDAYKALENAPESFKKTELMAQIHYRLEKYEECYASYRELIKNAHDEYEEERQTNLSAIIACLNHDEFTPEVDATEIHGESYEIYYNRACAYVSAGNYQKAYGLLKDALRTGREALKEDGLMDEELEDELSIVTVQRALCLQLMGRNKEAVAMYTRALKIKPTDVGVAAIAANNILCLNKDQNIFDSKKRLKFMRADGTETRLTKHQKRCILYNTALFYFHANQTELCEKACQTLLEQYPELKERTGLIRMASCTRAGNIVEAKKIANQLVKENPDFVYAVNLGLIQELLKKGKKADAVSFLKEMVDETHRPGLVSALVTIYQANGNNSEAAAVLKGAVDYFKNKKGDKSNMNTLWRQAASLMMEQGDHLEATKSLEELRRISPDDIVTLAQLIIAYAKDDTGKAEKLSEELPEVPIAQDLDASSLESSNWLSSIKYVKKSLKADSTPGSPVSTSSPMEGLGQDQIVTIKIPKKKKKRNKPPTNFSLNAAPDPERWIPRRERSGYRPKRNRKGRGDVGKGTQGAASETSLIYDMSNKSAHSPISEETTSANTSSTTPVWRKDQQKKKKKRR